MGVYTPQNDRAMDDILNVMNMPDASNEQLKAALGSLAHIAGEAFFELADTKEKLARAVIILIKAAPILLDSEQLAELSDILQNS